MSERTPTSVLVHGAFADSASWSTVIERLHHHGTVAADAVPVVAADRELARLVIREEPHQILWFQRLRGGVE